MATNPANDLVDLRPLESTDYGPLRRLELDLTLGPRWRHRGSTPSPEAFAQSLWQGVLAQFLVVRPGRPAPLGLVCAYGADLQSGTAWLAAARFPTEAHPATFGLGLRRFLQYLFDTWPLRKLYAEVLAPNLAPFERGATTLFREEGRLVDHAYLDGRYVDQHLLALQREAWEQGEALRTTGLEVPGRSGLLSLHQLHLNLAADLARTPEDLDIDLPLADQGLDSLDWVLVADRLASADAGHGPGSTDAEDLDDVIEVLGHHLTVRSLHRWLVDAAVRRGAGGAVSPRA